MPSGSFAIDCCYCMLLNYQPCNMWVLIPFFLSALSAYGLKEYVPFQEFPQNEKNLLFELVKRLENGNDLDELVKRKSNDQFESEQSSPCAVTTNKTSIIRKNDSLLNGAQFLTSVKNVKSNEACWQLCCNNKTCDVSVFEDKDDHYCYLFMCEGKCKFGHHASYISNFIEHSDEATMGSVADGSELDLMGFESLKVSKTTYYPTPAPLAEKTTAAAVYIRAHSVGLDGLLCLEEQHCEDPNAVCSANKCRCKDGYYNKGPICRKVCPPSNFECVGIGTLGLGPQCLARDLVCDSVTQCADGSDEFNCAAVEAGEAGNPPAIDGHQQEHPLPSRVDQQHLQAQPVHSLPEQPQSYPQSYPQPFFSGLQEEPKGSAFQFSPYGRSDGRGGWKSQQENDVYQGNRQQYGGHGSSPQQAGNVQNPALLSPGARPDLPYGSGLQGQAETGQSQLQGVLPAGPDSSSNTDQLIDHGLGDVSEAQSQQSQQSGQVHGDQQPHGNTEPGQSQPLNPPDKYYPSHTQSGGFDSQKHYAQPQGSQQIPYQAPVSKQHGQSIATKEESQGLPQQSVHNTGAQQKYTGNRTPSDHLSSAGNQISNQYPEENGIPEVQRPLQSKTLVPESKQTGMFTQGVVPAPKAIEAARPENGSLHSSNGDPHAVSAPSSAQGIYSRLRDSPRMTQAPAALPVDSQKTFLSPGQSKVQSHSNNNILKLSPGIPESLHPHAYDVRIGDPSVPETKLDSRPSKSFLNPSELSDVEPQNPSHFLEGFGDQYIPQKSYGQQYGTYSRYPSSFSQGSESGRGNRYQGYVDQIYSGGQGQRYPQQGGYLDVGYQPPQYDFSEFDPSYAEPDSYPGSRDIFHSDSRLGYHDDQGTKGGKHHKASKQPTEPEPVISLIGDHPRYSFSDSESHKSEASRPSSVADSFLSGSKGHEGLDTSEEDIGKPLKPMFEGGVAEVHSNSVSGGDSKPSNIVKTTPEGEATEKPVVGSTFAPSKGKSTEGERVDGTKSSVPVVQSENDANSSSMGVGGPDGGSGSAGGKDAGSGSAGGKDGGSVGGKDSGSAGGKDGGSGSVGSKDVGSAGGKDGGSGSAGGKDAGSAGGKDAGSGSTGSGSPDLVMQHDEIVMEHLDLSSMEGPSMQGPIIALSLGLAFTMVLLVFVACRLRNVRRRLKKGRPLHSNEADYLINGMYL